MIESVQLFLYKQVEATNRFEYRTQSNKSLVNEELNLTIKITLIRFSSLSRH